MLGSTLVLPLASGNVTLNRVRDDGYSSEYFVRGTGCEYRVFVRHNKTNATALKPAYDRHNFEIVKTVYADGDVPQYEDKAYFVIQKKANDVDVELADAMGDMLIASSNALVTELLGWQS
jgi:hypothetical protein